MPLNSPELDDGYAWRGYDAQWRSLRAGALLAVVVIIVAFIV